MRIISATIAAMVISVGQAALAQNLAPPDDDAAAAGMPSTRNDGQSGVAGYDATAVETLLSALPERPARPATAMTTATATVTPTAVAAPPTALQIVSQLPTCTLPGQAEAAADGQGPSFYPIVVPVAAPTAQEVVAQLPERHLTAPRGPTAQEVVAALPERQMAAPRGPTAQEVVAALPERHMAAPRGPTAQEVVAALPERRMAAPRGPTAQEVVAQLPERRMAAPRGPTAQEVVAQLPERRLAAPKRPTAAEIVAQLPERPVIAPVPEIVVPVVHDQDTADAGDEHPERDPEAMKPELQDPTAETEMPADPRYAALDEPNLGTTLELPRAVFSMPDGAAHKGVGRRYKTRDSRARVAVWTEPARTRHETPQGYLRRTFKIPRETVNYERYNTDFGVVSGLFGTRVYYIRCNLSKRTGAFHCFDLAYPARERQRWDEVVSRISRSLHASNESLRASNEEPAPRPIPSALP